MNESDQLLAAAPVPMAFFKLAIPAVAVQLINILYNLVDKMFIGHIPEVGKQALAGVGGTAPVILAISAFAALVSMGGAPKAIFLTICRRIVLLIPLIFLLPAFGQTQSRASIWQNRSRIPLQSAPQRPCFTPITES